MWLLFNLPLFY